MAAKRLAAVSHVIVARYLLLSDEVHADVRHTDRIQEIQQLLEHLYKDINPSLHFHIQKSVLD